MPSLDDDFFTALRASEFSRLDRDFEGGAVYLDYTGSALYGASQLRAHQEALASGLFGNPHSEHDASRASTAALDRAREATLRFFGVTTETHAVCFVANTSAAIKLVAESYPFGPDASLVLSADNHNSINGLREYARRRGAATAYLPLDASLRLANAEARVQHLASPGSLLAFPAQSNFSGVRHPLSLVDHAQALGMTVLLDAASFAPTERLDLSTCAADFVPVSFYKLFGYPTGIGALVARRDALARLERPWFAGGTVEYVSVQHARHRLRAGHEAFEDGTPDFLSALAIPAGFDVLAHVAQPRLSRRVRELTRYLLDGLAALRHGNGCPRIRIHGPHDTVARGGTVTFNVLDARGRVVHYQDVEARARAAGIALRGGCFCNPGAAEAAFEFDASRTASCLDALGDDFTIPRFAACLGPAAVVGAVRLSVGVPTTTGDLDRALKFLDSW